MPRDNFIERSEPTSPINPGHYRRHPSGVECITISRHFSFNLGNVIKCIWRAGLKSANPVEDLKKARWYLDDEIRKLKVEQVQTSMDEAKGANLSERNAPFHNCDYELSGRLCPTCGRGEA